MQAGPVLFFDESRAWREWLERNHQTARDLWVGFHKRSSGKPSITWPESVDVALCFGWIDGIRKSIDDASYKIRFTPRKARSTWSNVNIKRVQELSKRGLMHAAGLKAFEERDQARSGIYSFEQRKGAKLELAQQRQFKANKKAWSFFQSRPPWYQRTVIWWVISAKREETKLSRLATLIKDCERGRSIGPLTRKPK